MRYLVGLWILGVTAIGIGDVIFSEGYKFRGFERETKFWDTWHSVELERDLFSQSFSVSDGRCVVWRTSDESSNGVQLLQKRGQSWVPARADAPGDRDYRFAASRAVGVSYRLEKKVPAPGDDASCLLLSAGLYPNGFLPTGSPDNVFAIKGSRSGYTHHERGHRLGLYSEDGRDYCLRKPGGLELEGYWRNIQVLVATTRIHRSQFSAYPAPC